LLLVKTFTVMAAFLPIPSLPPLFLPKGVKTAMAAFLPLPPKGVGLVFTTRELQQTNNFEKVWAVKLN
jgi:hypothetical protein